MTETKKLKIYAIVVPCIISLIGVLYSIFNVSAQRMNEKLDKSQYEKDQKVVNDRLENCEIDFKTILIEIKDGQIEFANASFKYTSSSEELKENEEEKRRIHISFFACLFFFSLLS